MQQMRKFYFAILGTFSDYFCGVPVEEIHAELKCGYKIKTTRDFTKEQRIEYIDYTIQMFVEAH
jgi:hypothetical protein